MVVRRPWSVHSARSATKTRDETDYRYEVESLHCTRSHTAAARAAPPEAARVAEGYLEARLGHILPNYPSESRQIEPPWLEAPLVSDSERILLVKIKTKKRVKGNGPKRSRFSELGRALSANGITQFCL